MWSKSALGGSRRLCIAALLACELLACIGGERHGASAEPPGPLPRTLIERYLDPTDIVPADLDLVVRIDVGRMRAGALPFAADRIAAKAEEQAGDDVLRDALLCADVIWIGTRLGDLDGGDHVAVIEGKNCAPELPRALWERAPSSNGRIAIFDRKDDGAPRSGTAEVVILGPRATAFVSPMERDSVARVLREGPDARRGNPSAEGIVSVDIRAGRLPPALERKFPSISAIVGGLERIRGTAGVIDEGVKVDAEIQSSTLRGAEKALKFLEALRDNVADSRLAAMMQGVRIEQVEHTVHIHMVVPANVVLGMLSAPR